MASITGARWAWSAPSLCPGGCPPGQYCCPNRPSGGGTPTSGGCIPTRQTCSSAGCANPGEIRCGGECINVLTNVNNCGTCGNACTTNVANATAACVGGQCDFTCNAGLTRCGSQCVDLQTDENNCGTCGHVCPSGSNATPVCREGLCSVENTCTTSCCGCGYGNPTTGEFRESCFGSLVTDIFECEELCRVNTPPGFSHIGTAFPPVTSVCHGLICAPITIGSRCGCCEPTP
jgi:hypothetical protein